MLSVLTTRNEGRNGHYAMLCTTCSSSRFTLKNTYFFSFNRGTSNIIVYNFLLQNFFVPRCSIVLKILSAKIKSVEVANSENLNHKTLKHLCSIAHMTETSTTGKRG